MNDVDLNVDTDANVDVDVVVTRWHLELIDRLAAPEAGDQTRADVLRRALREHHAQLARGADALDAGGWNQLEATRPSGGDEIFTATIPVGVGRAIPVRRGEVLRIEQLHGGQCVDFNAYNLDDHKEFLDCGLNRQRGIFTGEGTVVWSSTPRARPMLLITRMADTCDQYYAGHRCTSVMYEKDYGLPDHPNCQDILAESIREFGLTPDDVHDSYNLWMSTELDADGKRRFVWNRGQAGDVCEMVAMFDLLAVPASCPGDIGSVNNYAPNEVRVSVLSATNSTNALVELVEERLGSFRNQQTPEDFAVKEIRTERRLTRDPSYVPQFADFGTPVSVPVPLSQQEAEMCRELLDQGSYGDSEGRCIVAAFCRWFELNHVLDRYTALVLKDGPG